MIIGYIRVSTDRQSVKNQRFEIEQFCKAKNLNVELWIEETISSTKDLNENQVYVFCPPRISSLSLNATERTKERLLERQRLLFSPSTPIDEKMKLFMRTEYVGETHYEAYAVRPVADKKWKGKLYK